MEAGFSYAKGPHKPDFLREEVLGDFFVNTAKKHPAACAFVTEEKTWTYGEIDRWSYRIAQGLWAAGSAPLSAVDTRARTSMKSTWSSVTRKATSRSTSPA